MLATEHWSLLASRTTTQNEVLARIAIFLTLVSAGLVALGFVGQASGFRGWFGVAALAVLLTLAVLGAVTELRVWNTATEDLMYVVAMNRLRAGYLALDPGMAPYLMASPHDDLAGSRITYHFFFPRGPSQVAGSSMTLIAIVEGVVLGLFVGGGLSALGAPAVVAVIVAVVVFLLEMVAAVGRGYALYRRSFLSYEPVNPTVE